MLEIRYREASRAALWRVDKACPLRYTAGVLREGEIRATWTSSPSTTPAYKMPLYQYTGQAAYLDDPLTSGVTEGFGLMFYNARWYDPGISEFTQPDTLIPNLYNSADWNRYGYARYNPIRYNDPSGHCPTCLIGAGIGAVVGGVAYGAYAAYTGNFNGWHLAAAIGGGALAGALIGTGVGFAAGVGAAEATAAAVGGAEAANVACGGDMCASEVQDASRNIQLACGGDCSDEVTSAGNTLSSQAQSFLNKLPTAGSNTPAPSGQINSGIMAELQHATGDEFALVRAQGERLLVRGSQGFVQQLPEGVTRIIAHTHPWFASTVPTSLDYSALATLGQRWSLIISEYGSVGKFFAK